MPRQPRIIGNYMHIIMRGIGKQILFEDHRDYKKMLQIIKKYKTDTGITILAYCLMENHIHLLIQDELGNTPDYMKKIGVSYAHYYNEKYQRTGHLFQDRYTSELVCDQKYLLAVFRYILNNPAKAGISSANTYLWNSYHEYGLNSGITNTTMLRSIIGSKANLMHFLRIEDNYEFIEAGRRKRDDQWAISVIKESLHINSGTQIQQFEKKNRDAALATLREKGLTVRQIERLTGINRGVIQHIKCDKGDSPLCHTL